MSTETLIGSYILCLSIKQSCWQIGLHDVRGGEAQILAGFVAGQASRTPIVPDHRGKWNADGTPSGEDKPIQEDIVLPNPKKEPQKD